MSNVLSLKFGGVPVDFDGVQKQIAALKGSADEDPRSGNVFLNFSGKQGRWTMGADGTPPPEDELWMAHPMLFEIGWICWANGKPKEKRMALIQEPRVAVPDPNEHGPFSSSKDGWFPAKGLALKAVFSGTVASFTTNSKSGVSAVSSVERAIADRMAADAGPFPVMRLDMSSFTAQGHQNYKPEFEIVGFFSRTFGEAIKSETQLSEDDVFENLEDATVDRESLTDIPMPKPAARTPRAQSRSARRAQNDG